MDPVVTTSFHSALHSLGGIQVKGVLMVNWLYKNSLVEGCHDVKQFDSNVCNTVVIDSHASPTPTIIHIEAGVARRNTVTPVYL